MTESDNNFALIEKYFDELIECDEKIQNTKVSELVQQGILNNQQAQSLKSILKADKNTQIETNIQFVSGDLLDEINSPDLTPEQKQVGPYLIEKSIGEGGMGQVYLALRNDGEFEQQVAIKLPHFNIDKQTLYRFENERQILAQLTHPNIAHLLDGGTTTNNQPYLVMEYVQGKAIDQYCIDNIPTLKQRIKLIIQICDAVAFAHQKLVLHRDLKPNNILVTDNGRVKLLDFGIAKLFNPNDETLANKTATQIMTRNYASPEQIQGKMVSTQSDLFSLSIIAYELLTGFHPFLHNNQLEREQNLVSGKIMRVTSRKLYTNKALFPELSNISTDKISGDLENILLKALEHTPEKRYRSVQDFIEDLSNFISNRTVNARKPSFLYSAKKLVQRHLIASLAVLLTLTTLVTSSLFSWHKAKQAQTQSLIAEQQKSQAQLEAKKATLISEFMQDMFKKAQPTPGSDHITAKDLLDQASSQLKNNPEIDAESKYKLLSVIFISYINLQQVDNFQEGLDGTYQSCLKDLDEKNSNCLTLLKFKAFLQHKKGNEKKSISLYHQLEQTLRNKTPKDNDFLALVLRESFSALMNDYQYDLAEKNIEEALLLSQNSKNFDPVIIFDTRVSMAYSFIFKKQFDKAQIQLEKIHQYLTEYQRMESKEMATYLHINAVLLAMKSKPKESIVYREKAIKLLEKIYPNEKPNNYTYYLRNIARYYFQAGDLAKSIKAYDFIIDYYKNTTNGTNKLIKQSYIRKLMVILAQGDYQNAQKTIQVIESIELGTAQSTANMQCLYKYADAHLSVLSESLSQAREKIKNYQTCSQTKTMTYYTVYGLILDAVYANKINENIKAKEYLNKALTLWDINPNDYLGVKIQVDSLISKTL